MPLADPLLWAYIPAALLLTLSPGPDMAVVTRNALLGGPRAATATAIGTVSGLLVHGSLVAAGLAALLQRDPGLFRLVQALGGLVLVGLGLRTLLATANPPSGSHTPAGDGAADGSSPLRYASAGFATNVLNPKVALFYLAFLPQFIPTGAAVGPRVILLAAIHGAMNLLWLPAYGTLVHRSTQAAPMPLLGPLLEKAVGALLVGLGLLALARATLPLP